MPSASYINPAILDNTGAVVVRYIYDAWGNHAVLDANGNDIDDPDHIGNLNPFRYRGYYYDVETGLYFLQTRYYDPEVGRFISQDSVEYADPTTVNGLNLYAYCGNNPVMGYDPTGTSFLLISLLVGLIIGAVAGGVIGGVTAAQNGATGWEIAGAVYLGVILGGNIGGIAGALIGVGIPLLSSGLGAIGGAGGIAALAGGGTLAAGAAAGVASVGLGAGLVIAGGGIAIGGLGLQVSFARTPKVNGYYGERWAGDHDPEHIHLRGNDIDIRIGKDGHPLPGEDPLPPQAKKALKKLWDEFLKLFKRY